MWRQVKTKLKIIDLHNIVRSKPAFLTCLDQIWQWLVCILLGRTQEVGRIVLFEGFLQFIQRICFEHISGCLVSSSLQPLSMSHIYCFQVCNQTYCVLLQEVISFPQAESLLFGLAENNCMILVSASHLLTVRRFSVPSRLLHSCLLKTSRYTSHNLLREDILRCFHVRGEEPSRSDAYQYSHTIRCSRHAVIGVLPQNSLPLPRTPHLLLESEP